ncbi:uncharacterized protein LOC127866960 isoform X1 [Dreissena polymorpha]|uniref:uncharacterized protein LOC127866960 isoform X1 n=1 Tax=Dreissena polymorpha TaxID=45954 RepID=UPI002263C937|nr:uncharacterized protein LOC127866960 isoform X1 [Dreissena polymorpha]
MAENIEPENALEENENENDAVISMVDYLKEEEELENDANAVLGGSDDTQCTYSLARVLNRRKKPYDKDNLKRAFDATLKGMSVYRASRLYNIPESTLRDRTRYKVDIDCKLGAERLLTCEEESKLADHILLIAKIGYRCSVNDIRCMAADFARSLGKNVRAKGKLSSDWFYGFEQRWPQLKALKLKKVGLPRTKTTSEVIIDGYCRELGSILHRNGLLDAPERIWIVDESSFSSEHSPSKIAKDSKAQVVTSLPAKTVTMVVGINAEGNHAPPFYIFPGKRWNDSFLEGTVAGSVGKMSGSDWSKMGIFEEYVTSHLAQYAALSVNTGDNPITLILYDGHKSHLSLTLTTWAVERNVILFVLPTHSRHLTHPLDMGVFGPMKEFYHSECLSFLCSNPGMSIKPRDIGRLTAKPFTEAFCVDNITSAFRNMGIYPCNVNEINDVQTAPVTIHVNTHIKQSDQVSEVVAGPSTCTDNATSLLNPRRRTTVMRQPKKKLPPPVKIIRNLNKNE